MQKTTVIPPDLASVAYSPPPVQQPGDLLFRRNLSEEAPMSALGEYEIKRWTMRRKRTLVLEGIQGGTTVAEACRRFDIPPSEIERLVDDGKRGADNGLRAKPQGVREHYGRQLNDLQRACGEAIQELRARKSGRPCWVRMRSDGHDPAGAAGRWARSLDDGVVPLIRVGTAQRLLPAGQGTDEGQAGAGQEQVQSARGLPTRGLAGTQASCGQVPANPGFTVCGDCTGLALGDRPLLGLRRPGRLAHLRPGNRLPYRTASSSTTNGAVPGAGRKEPLVEAHDLAA
jgi:transposase-like protein